MSAGSIFEPEEDRAAGRKTWLIGVVALVVIAGAAYGIVQYSKPVGPTADEILAQKIRDSTVLMLDYSTFSGKDFREQILGKGRLEKYIKVNDEAFFTYPQSDEQEFNDFQPTRRTSSGRTSAIYT